VKIAICDVPPSANVYQRAHWAVKRRLRQRFAWIMRTELMLQTIPAPPTGKRSVTITIHRNRALDPDNLTGGCKPLIDAMRDIGLIKNDSPKWITLSVAQVPCRKGQERTEIEINDIGRNPSEGVGI